MARTKKTKQIATEELENEAETSVFDAPETEESDFASSDNAIDDLDLDAEEKTFCIFQDVGTPLVKSGDRVRFLVWRNGEYLTTLDWFPEISWDHISKKYGGGTYTIRCRSTKRNGIVKSQSETLAGDVHEEPVKTLEPVAIPQAQNSVAEMVALINQTNQAARQEQKADLERIRQDAKERAEESKANNLTMMQMMTNMFTAMQPKSDNGDLQLKLAQMQMDNQKQTTDLMMKMMDASNKRMESMIESLSKKKDDGPSAIELLALQSAAEQRGYERAQEIQEIAQEKAEEIAALNAVSDNSEDGKESLMTTVMKGVVPLLAQAPTTAPVLQAPVPTPIQRQNIRVPVRTQAKAMPMPARPVAPAQKRPDIQIPKVAPKKGVLMNGDKKKFIQETAVEVIGQKLLANDTDFKAGGDELLKRVEPQGIDAKDLCSQFTLQDMIKTAGELGMPPAINPYLEGMYAHIASKAGTATREPTQASEAGAQVQ